MEVKRFGVLSVGKVTAVLYAFLRFVLGAINALVFMAISSFGASSPEASKMMFGGLFFGVGSLLFLPILYGVLGAIFAMLSALLYNGVARLVGGIEVDLEQR